RSRVAGIKRPRGDRARHADTDGAGLSPAAVRMVPAHEQDAGSRGAACAARARPPRADRRPADAQPLALQRRALSPRAYDCANVAGKPDPRARRKPADAKFEAAGYLGIPPDLTKPFSNSDFQTLCTLHNVKGQGKDTLGRKKSTSQRITDALNR